MGRDVEFNATFSDKTERGLTSVERRVKATNDRLKKENDRAVGNFGQSVISAAEKVSPKLAASLTQGFSEAAEAAAPLLAGAAVAAAPFIAGTLSAAIIGGAGIGGVVGGVLLASRDARVQAAGKDLGDGLLSSLTVDANVFVDPVLQGIGKIRTGFQEVEPAIQSIFKNSSKYVAPLVDGIVRGTQGIVRGVDIAIGRAGPVIDAIGQSFEDLGNDVGDFFANVSIGADGGAAAVRDLTDTVGNLLDVIGPVIGGLSKIFGWLDKIHLIDALQTQLLGPLGYLLPFLDKGSDKTKKLADSNEDLAASQRQAKAATDAEVAAFAAMTPNLQDIASATQAIISANRQLYGSETNAAQAIADATKAIKDNGKGLDIHTQKGRDNRKSLDDVAGALKADYDNLVAVNGLTGETAKKGDGLRASFVKLAEKTGLSAKAARELADKILGIPNSHDTKITADAEKARDAAREAQRAIDAVHGKMVTITINAALTAQARRLTGSGLSNSAINSALRKNFDATQSFAFADGAGSSRIGGATPVSVSNAVDVSVFLDGSAVDARTDTKIRASEKRQQHRQQVSAR